MALPDDVKTQFTANSNEPGPGPFNPKNVSAIQWLIDNPLEGKGSTTDHHGGDPIYEYGPTGAILDVQSYDDSTYSDQFEQFGVQGFLDDRYKFEEELIKGEISPELLGYMEILLADDMSVVRENVYKIYPRAQKLVVAFKALAQEKVDERGGTEAVQKKLILSDDFIKVFGDYDSAIDFENTQSKINKHYVARADTPPASVNPWEFRLGASRFFVPPLNINVTESFKVGSLAGGALRSSSTPKFNSGHSETVIDMTLYFPTHESIWGYSGTGKMTMDFDKASDQEIDQFISSLRGLITQFKYAPFLPVRNEYLNRTYNITALALHSMTIQTVEGFPFCVVVNLQMLKFNFEPFLPPIGDFNQAIHWGRYRQYVGRAAQKLNSIISQGFLIEENNAGTTTTNVGPTTTTDTDEESVESAATIIRTEYKPSIEFDKLNDFEQGKHFALYYPIKTPGKVFSPDTSDFRTATEDSDLGRDKNAWEIFLGVLTLDVDTDPGAIYDELLERNSSGSTTYASDRDKLLEFLKPFGSSAETMTSGRLQEYIDKRIKEAAPGTNVEELERWIKQDWFNFMFEGWRLTPFYQDYLANATLADGNYLIKEWQVPMDEVPFDWSKIVIEGINVSMANNIVRLQVQMQKDPVHQHIGARDSSVNVSMLVFGEEELTKFRRVFDHINGLARLEHAHGVLGFLGIKNVLTALAGIKYVLPMSFEVETVPNYPHVYRVRLSLVDFDVFQQKREELSVGQQKQLTDAFGKRNPFLRIKQLWGAFNAYPDFPLSVHDEAGNIVGHLDPDFYFRGFQMYDDDILYWGTDEAAAERGEGSPTAEQNEATHRQIKALQDALERVGITQEERERITSELNILLSTVTPNEGLSHLEENLLSSRTRHEHNVFWSMGLHDENQSKQTEVKLGPGSLSVGESSANGGGATYGPTVGLSDSVPEDQLYAPAVNGLAAYSQYQSAHADGSSNPTKHWELMLTDAAYRDISGRMIRAFPTYMLWLIDEGGRFAGVKMFDNFYGLQSIIDFSVVHSEDILGDTLVLRLSNLYKKLTTPYSEYLFKDQGAEEENKSEYSFIDSMRDVNRNMQSGMDDRFLVELENIRLKPGVRLHLRAGYSANPNSLQTIFNGTITEVRAGDIVEVVAQSDAIELSPFLNTTSKDGHTGSGELGGGINTGFWMSEPRDLMVRILSMGSSSFKESFGHATQGMIFSENKFGIRHFGQMLYAPLGEAEKEKHEMRYNAIKSAMDRVAQAGPVPSAELGTAGAAIIGNVAAGSWDAALDHGGAATRSPIIAIGQSMWNNFLRKRDYEIFKRNIYPGNGTGVAQFLGGDSLDGGVTLALAYNSEDTINKGTPEGTSNSRALENASLALSAEALEDAQAVQDETGIDADIAAADAQGGDPSDVFFNGPFNGKENSPIFKALGLVSDVNDDDMSGFDEVSFRAQTYMKSVWDIFQVCAALLPNYIVAVRPFEDRSTVFYGKPHWLYTSGLIPISTGIPPSVVEFEKGDEDLQRLKREALEAANAFSDFENQMKFFQQAGAVNPYTTDQGVVWNGGDIASLPDTHPNGAKIPIRKTKIGIEMHLPTHGTAAEDAKNHIQLPDLPADKRHPMYMDKVGGGRGGVDNYDPLFESPTSRGTWGAFETLDPEVEQWYMNMPWPYHPTAGAGANPYYIAGHKYAWYNPNEGGPKKVIIYATKTKKACICAIGEFGPAASVIAKGISAGASPDVFHYLGIVHGDEVEIAFVPDGTPLGPTSGTGVTAGTIQTGGEVTEEGEEGGVKKISEILTIDDAEGFESEIEFYKNNDGEYYTEADIRTMDNGDPIEGDAEKIDVYDQHNRVIGRRTFLQDGFIDSIDFTEEEFEEAWDQRLTSDDGNKGDLIKALGGIENTHWSRMAHNNNFFYAYEYGAFDNKVPVWIAPSSGATVQPGKADIVGITARRLYDKDYNALFAKQSGATDLAATGSITIEDYDVGTHFLDYSGVGPSGGRNLKQAQTIWHELREKTGFHQFDKVGDIFDDWETQNLMGESGTPHPGPPGGGPLSDTQRRAYAASFLRFMWQEPYARAWVIMTTNRQKDNVSLTDNLDIDLENFTSWGNDDRWDFEGSPLIDMFAFFLVTTDIEVFDQRDEDTNTYTAAAIGQRQKLLSELAKHNKQGLDSAALLDRGLENLKNTFDQTLGQVWKAIAAGLSGLTALYRISMMQMGNGLSNAGTMQRQASMINRVFNDSIYYAAGQPGDLIRLADNPFTREYGEPVVEIREPFQRMHYISSFQHILSNNIVENLTDVPTVVTATSDGNYPVTVYFDKGAPPDKQFEKVVETGLFWDNARGSGFFGFLHPLLHPIETARGLIKNATGTPDELSSKRVALYHLKEGLKDIYMGEVVVLGDPDIRPHDLVYLADVYERMYGIFEVEQVVHHFTPETGFITSITPNALVTVNDPTRWSMLSWVWSWFAVKNIRDDVRSMAYARGSETSQLSKTGGVTLEELAKSLEPQMLGHLQYAHGNAALIRDLASAAAIGNMGMKSQSELKSDNNVPGSLAREVIISALPGVNMLRDIMSTPWNWVKDNLIDQHGCYIQYLNKDGQPMDSGLSYNQGVAVGRHHSVTILPGILGLEVPISRDGHKRITQDDVLGQLGWNEIEINTVERDISYWVSQTNAQILKAAGKSPDQLPFTAPEFRKVTVHGGAPITMPDGTINDPYFDGDTFHDTEGGKWRLAGVSAVEIYHTSAGDGQLPVDQTYAENHMGYQAAAYLRKRLYEDPVAAGFEPTVYLRIGANTQTYDRTAVVAFHNIPEGNFTQEERDALLEKYATQNPLIEWDAYTYDGKPYTINWEVIAAGMAQTSMFGNNFDTDRGAIGIGRQ